MSPELPTLSRRERQVLYLLAEGKTNKEIAHELSICQKTVEFHLGKVFAKIGVGTRTEAALWARQHSLVRKN
ncbi:MAG: response regulator transcription factor [Anaerolineales bacterium]|nr:response regulator transcription factor [Anaerolineales bacterium]